MAYSEVLEGGLEGFAAVFFYIGCSLFLILILRFDLVIRLGAFHSGV